MFRHFSEQIKEYQIGKSYHFDENIGFKSIPSFLENSIVNFQSIKESEKFNSRNIDFIFNKQKYSIWFRPFSKYEKGNVKRDFLRVQTFYPIENEKDMNRIKGAFEVAKNDFRYLINAT